MTERSTVYRLDLANLPAAAVRRSVPGPGGWLAATTLLFRRLAGTPVWSEELYRSQIELRVAGEAQWGALRAPDEVLARARAYREECNAAHCEQIGSFVTLGLPTDLGMLVYKTADGVAVTISVEPGGPAALDVWAAGSPTIVIGTEPALLPPAPGYAQGWLKNGRLEQLLLAARERAAHRPDPKRPDPRPQILTPRDFHELFVRWWADHVAHWAQRGCLAPVQDTRSR